MDKCPREAPLGGWITVMKQSGMKQDGNTKPEYLEKRAGTQQAEAMSRVGRGSAFLGTVRAMLTCAELLACRELGQAQLSPPVPED